MKGLSKGQIKQRDEIAAKLRDKADDVNSAEEAVQEAIERLNEVVREYNDLVTEANDFVVEVAGEGRDYIDEKSERWQEGDRGQEVAGFVEEWEGVELDEVEEAELQFDFGERDAAEDLESLPDTI